MTRLARRDAARPPEVFWLLGLAALLPAWLIAFVGLLGSETGRLSEKALAAPWILSTAAALLGVIVTDARVQRLRAMSDRCPAARYWLIGVGALLPAWAIALLGRLWAAFAGRF